MSETRRDRALRVATAYAIATGVRGISRENRMSKEPLYLLLNHDVNLVDYMAELKTQGNTTIHLSQITGNGGNANVELIDSRDKFEIVAHGITESESWNGRKMDKQLNKTPILKQFGLTDGMDIRDLEERIEAEVGKDPLFGKAIVYEGDDRVLLEAIDARNRASGVFDSRLAHTAKKVAKSPHTYQLALAAATLGFFNIYGQHLAQELNKGTSHPGVVKWFYDMMMSKDPLKIFFSQEVKLTASWLVGGFLSRFLGSAIDLPKEYAQRRKLGRGVPRVGLECLASVPVKTLDLNHYGDGIGRDAIIGACMPIPFMIVFGLSNAAGDVACTVLDAASKAVTGGHLELSKLGFNSGISLPVTLENEKMILEPVRYTIGSGVRSAILCFAPGISGLGFLLPAKYGVQTYLADSGGTLGAVARPFVEGYHSTERLIDRIIEDGPSFGTFGRHVDAESRALWSYTKDVFTRTRRDPRTRVVAKRADGTMYTYWAPGPHILTSSLQGGVIGPKGDLLPYQKDFAAVMAPVLPLLVMFYQKIFAGKPKDIYQNRVSPKTYEVLTGRAATTPA